MRTHFTFRTFRVDTWTPDGESIVEHIAGRRTIEVARVRITDARRRVFAESVQAEASKRPKSGESKI
jgi:hypothetical protein